MWSPPSNQRRFLEEYLNIRWFTSLEDAQQQVPQEMETPPLKAQPTS